MANLSDDQLLELAHIFHNLAFAVGQVRLDALNAGGRLSDPGMIQLNTLLLQLTDLASRFAVASAMVTLDNTEEALTTIRVSTGKADRALRKLKDIDKALAIGAAALALGAAVFTMNPGSIATTAQELWKAAS